MTWDERRHALGKAVLEGFYERRLFRTWLRDKPEGWELVSGAWSPFYIQARDLPSHCDLFATIGSALAELIKQEIPQASRLVGVATAGIPIAAAVGLSASLPMIYTRKLPDVRNLDDLTKVTETYGDHSMVQGEISEGDQLVIIDDVVARFTSKDVAIRQIEMELERRKLRSVSIAGIVVIIDREEGAAAGARRWGIGLHSLLRLRSDGLSILTEIASEREVEVVRQYLENPSDFQDAAKQQALLQEAKALCSQQE